MDRALPGMRTGDPQRLHYPLRLVKHLRLRADQEQIRNRVASRALKANVEQSRGASFDAKGLTWHRKTGAAKVAWAEAAATGSAGIAKIAQVKDQASTAATCAAAGTEVVTAVPASEEAAEETGAEGAGVNDKSEQRARVKREEGAKD